MNPRDLLRRLFDAAIAASDPALCVPPHMPPDDGGRLIVIGAGKASAARPCVLLSGGEKR